MTTLEMIKSGGTSCRTSRVSTVDDRADSRVKRGTRCDRIHLSTNIYIHISPDTESKHSGGFRFHVEINSSSCVIKVRLDNGYYVNSVRPILHDVGFAHRRRGIAYFCRDTVNDA